MTDREYVVITVPGIGEAASAPDTSGLANLTSHELGLAGAPTGMLANLTRKLGPRFKARQFNWQNTYGPVPVWDGASYGRNKEAAVGGLVDVVARILRTTHYAVVLVGYSGGAHVASEALTRLHVLGFTGNDLPAAVMVSNPTRGRHDSPTSNRWGIAGEHGSFPVGMKLIDVANPVDVICCCPPPPHPLRAFTDLSEHFSLADPVGWGVQLVEKAKRGQLQNAWRLSSIPAWFDAVALGRGYLFDGQHTLYYVPRLGMVAGQLEAALP